MEAHYLSWGWLLLEWHLLPQMVQAAFCHWGLPEVNLLTSSHTTQCQHYYTLETPLLLGALGLNAFNHPWMFQVGYMFPLPVLVPVVLSMFLAEHVIILDWCSLASHSSQLVGRHSSALFHHKRSHCKCFSRPCTQRSGISTFNPLAAQRFVLCRLGFSSLVCQAMVGATWASTSKVYQQYSKEWARLVCSRGCTKQCHICP